MSIGNIVIGMLIFKVESILLNFFFVYLTPDNTIIDVVLKDLSVIYHIHKYYDYKNISFFVVIWKYIFKKNHSKIAMTVQFAFFKLCVYLVASLMLYVRT